jgi:hypothetical protein
MTGGTRRDVAHGRARGDDLGCGTGIVGRCRKARQIGPAASAAETAAARRRNTRPSGADTHPAGTRADNSSAGIGAAVPGTRPADCRDSRPACRRAGKIIVVRPLTRRPVTRRARQNTRCHRVRRTFRRRRLRPADRADEQRDRSCEQRETRNPKINHFGVHPATTTRYVAIYPLSRFPAVVAEGDDAHACKRSARRWQSCDRRTQQLATEQGRLRHEGRCARTGLAMIRRGLDLPLERTPGPQQRVAFDRRAISR